ncbi:phosphate transporter [Jaminaea rosea]|uniref:Phosphate transporter n=1 Tax=Jaminaea rosea TaxID=1569628 RepID=A0A316ULJ7_9BASI|nr:phosphate transporter [Jaminaea rosea]PWN26110.1 phosphate transporter [Jaminaea rosea]
MPYLHQYDYLMGIGTIFAMLDAYNNGANDVANAWATSVSSRSISYRMAMVCALVFELLGALTVGARTADTIKNGIIPPTAFRGNAGVQMLAFTCALAGASSWVMWCTRHSAHVSSTYSLISAVAGVGIATAGARNVQWGWNNGKGLGAIFAGLGMAPICSAGFGAITFLLIKLVVHLRRNPVPWAVWTSPFFFLIAGTVCSLSIVYKGSPNLGLDKKPPSFIVAVSLGTGFGLALLSALFFVPWLHAKVIKKDQTLKAWQVIMGPLLWSRPYATEAESAVAIVPNYAVVQHKDYVPNTEESTQTGDDSSDEKIAPVNDLIAPHKTYQELEAEARERLHAKLRQGTGPLGWAMRYLHANPIGDGACYETHNMKLYAKRLPAMCVVALLYGSHYDIHVAQAGVAGTPEGNRMERVYAHAKMYPNEVEHTYSFIQLITACTASFAHGANDIGNAVAPWAVIYSAWSTGNPAASKLPVATWQIAVLALVLVFGFVTYGYKIMTVMGSKLTYHSPSRGTSMELGAAITILIFSQYKLPVSTSMCITGATVGVGLCNGTFKAVNWQRVGLLFLSWIVTIPIAGLLAGLPMAAILAAPRFV